MSNSLWRPAWQPTPPPLWDARYDEHCRVALMLGVSRKTASVWCWLKWLLAQGVVLG